MLALLVFITVC